MRTIAGLAKDVAEIIRGGGLLPSEPVALAAAVDPGEAVGVGSKLDHVSMAFDPKQARGEVRTYSRGRFVDRCSFFAEARPAAEPDDDSHTAALAKIRAALAEQAAIEFGPVLVEVEL